MRTEGWNQLELANRVGVNRNTIRRWVSGETANAATASVRLVADAAKIPYEEAARAVLGAQKQQSAADDRAIRTVMESHVDDDYKKQIIENIKRRRDEAEAAILRDVELMISDPRAQTS